MDLEQYIGKLESASAINWRENSLDSVKNIWVNINQKTITNWLVIDKNVNNQIIFYLARSERFTGDLNKGILLIGNTGSGKTRMMKSLSLAMGYLHRFRFLIYSGNEIEKAFRNETEIESQLTQKMFGIDDLGEEHNKVKVYGTDINVGVEVLSNRYNLMIKNGSLTFATTNLTRAMLLKKYGARIDSRIDEMFNVFTVTGDDLRKKITHE